MRVVFISGLSGSGKSTAKKCFEDMGYFTIDNLPVPLVAEFLRLILRTHEGVGKVAMVMDARGGDSIQQLPQVIDQLKQNGEEAELLYLDSSDTVLQRRYSETRRKHPLSPDEAPKVGIAKERELLKGLRDRSDAVIDTSKINVHELKQTLLQRYMGQESSRTLSIRVTSFGYRNGLPPDADLIFDARFLPNPFFRKELRDWTGLEKPVRDFVLGSEAGKEFQQKLFEMVDYLVPHFLEEGKSYLNIGIGCTGGKHRSVALAHQLAAHLKELGHQVKVDDRDIKLA